MQFPRRRLLGEPGCCCLLVCVVWLWPTSKALGQAATPRPTETVSSAAPSQKYESPLPVVTLHKADPAVSRLLRPGGRAVDRSMLAALVAKRDTRPGDWRVTMAIATTSGRNFFRLEKARNCDCELGFLTCCVDTQVCTGPLVGELECSDVRHECDHTSVACDSGSGAGGPSGGERGSGGTGGMSQPPTTTTTCETRGCYEGCT